MKDWKQETKIYKEAIKLLVKDIKRAIITYEDWVIGSTDLNDMIVNRIDIEKVYYNRAKRELEREGKL